MEYALVSSAGRVVDVVVFEEPPAELAPSKGRWLPVVDVDALFNSDTQVRDPGPLSVEATRVTRGFTVRNKTTEEIGQMKAQRLRWISDRFHELSQGPIEIPTTAEGLRSFDADDIARGRIMALLVLASCGAPITFPRPWTPAEALSPVEMTMGDMVMLGAAIAAREDALFVIKKRKESDLIGLTTAADVAAYDIEAGWG